MLATLCHAGHMAHVHTDDSILLFLVIAVVFGVVASWSDRR